MRKILSLVLCVVLIAVFGLFAMGSGSDSDTDTNTDQGSGSVENVNGSDDKLGDYQLTIESCRMAKSYDDKDVVIVKYKYTNTGDEAASFSVAFDDNAFQNGVGLNPAYILADSANYSADNQSKDIQKGASIEVEVAYELNDSTTDVVIEVEELFSFSDKKITKTFKLQ